MPLMERDAWKGLVLQSAKLPLFYLILGTLLTALSFTDNLFPITRTLWQNVFDFTDKLGTIFIALSFITFIYNLIVLACRSYEKILAEKHAVAALILSSVRKGLRIIFVLVAINIIIILLGPTQFYLMFANNIINSVIIGSIGWIALQILYTCEAVLYQYMMTITSKENVRVKALYTKLRIIRNITTVLIIVVTIAAILMSFSSVRNIGISLLASAGFITAIVGLSAQRSLFSLFSGLQIALSQTIRIGDIVAIENASGMIEEITFTFVTLKLGDNRRLIVPISYFIEKPFENWSREIDSIHGSMHFFVDYMLPITPLRHELQRILQDSHFWDEKVSKLQVSNLTERAVEIRIQVSAADADNLSNLRAEIREKMLDFIREHYPEQFPKVRYGGMTNGTEPT